MIAQAELFTNAEPALTDQQSHVLRLLQTNPSLTRLEGMMAGIGNLPARVMELREMGYRIHTVAVKGQRYGKYVLARNEEAA